jgi:HD-like signal output (HDOD) protein
MTKEALKAIVDEAEDFPMLPPTATQIARLTTDLSAPVKEIANKIESDNRLLGRMLTMVNAPFYGVSGPITRIADAISLLGYRKVCNLAVGISALGIFPAKKEHGFDYGRFWQHSILAGVSAGVIASRIPGDQPADVFSSALLQDVGILFLVRHQPLEYGTALGISKGQNIPLVVAERDSWGGIMPNWGLRSV